jgi:hypothetical protein
MQHAGGMLLPPVQKLVATFIFLSFGKEKCKSNPSSFAIKKPNHTIRCGFFFFAIGCG